MKRPRENVTVGDLSDLLISSFQMQWQHFQETRVFKQILLKSWHIAICTLSETPTWVQTLTPLCETATINYRIDIIVTTSNAAQTWDPSVVVQVS